MTDLLFFHIGRQGITWIAAATPPAPGAAAARGGVAELARAAARCGGVVAWNAGKQRAALAKIAPVFGELDAVELPGAAPPAPFDALAVAGAYFAADGGVLPAGCRPSAEQWAVANATARGLNVLCRAVAGAGKTTTLLICAARAPAQAHLLLTYNKRLQVDVARRARPNVTVLTYHAAAGRSYGDTVRNDEQFRRCVRAAPETPLRFDVLLVDESQDMAVEYFALVRHLLAANPGARMIVVGDELQSINEYRGAHPGFLTEAPALYRGALAAAPPRAWVSCRLSVSHRLTPATAAFVNAHLYRARVITGGNLRAADRRPVYVAAAGKEGVARALAAATREAVAEFGADGVFVLAPSVRGLATKASPIALLVRHHLAGVPVFIADDDARVDEALVRGKLAIMSFNAVKGCERRCVIAVGLDETYFRYFERGWKDPLRIPNLLAVAATRAIDRLVVVAAAKDTLRSVDFDRLAALAEVRGKPARPRARAPAAPRKQTVTVTQLVRHLHPETLRAAMAGVVAVRAADDAPRPPPFAAGAFRGTFEYGGGTIAEDFAAVYGVLAPVLAEVARSGTTAFGVGLDMPTIHGDARAVKAALAEDPAGYHITAEEHGAYPPEFWGRISAALAAEPGRRSFGDWAVLAVMRGAFSEGRHHIARQVTHYDWVNAGVITGARDAVLRVLEGVAGAFEVPIPRVTVGLKTIVGVADFVEAASAAKPGGAVWEFKLGELAEEHELQLACYLALRGGGEGRLVSILHREARTVYVGPEDAAPLLALLAERAGGDGLRDVAQVVADFDAGLDAAFGPVAARGDVDSDGSAGFSGEDLRD
jgi:hypothetical protein